MTNRVFLNDYLSDKINKVAYIHDINRTVVAELLYYDALGLLHAGYDKKLANTCRNTFDRLIREEKEAMAKQPANK